MSSKAELRIQGHSFFMDLHILPVHGPDVILGMSWLQSLRRVTSDYEVGTLEFENGGAASVFTSDTACAAASFRSDLRVDYDA